MESPDEYIQVMEVIEAFESLQAKFSIVDNSLYLMEFICGWYHKYKERKLEEKFCKLVGINDNAVAEQEILISTAQQEMWQSILNKSKQMFNELAELQRNEEQLQASKNFRDNSSKNILSRFIQNVTEVLFPKPLSKLAISLSGLNDLLMTHQETVDELVQKGVATREATKLTFDDTRDYFEEKFYDAYDYFSFDSFAGNYDTQTPYQGSVYEGSFEAFNERFRMRNRRFHKKKGNAQSTGLPGQFERVKFDILWLG